MGRPGILTKIAILLSLFSVISSLSPPSVLYGGWTPILPGHPFHFGPVRRRHHEQYRHHQQHEDERPSLPYHQVEHHFEQHVELVEPKQHHRPPFVYSSHQTDKGQAYGPVTNKNNHVEYHSTYAQQPIKTQDVSYVTNVPNKENYIFHPPHQSNYNGPQVQAPYIGQSIVSSGYEPNKEVYKIYPAQTDYSKHGIQKPGNEQQVNYGIKPNQNINEIYPPQTVSEGRYVQGPIGEQYVFQSHKPDSSPGSFIGNLYGQKPLSEQLDTSGQKSKKNIFEYYPHPSTYDAPKGLRVNHKPMYYEYPKRPLDGFEIPYQKNPFASSSFSGSPLNQLIGHRPIVNLDEKTFLKISPLDFRALKSAGDDNVDTLHNLGLESPKHGGIPAIQNPQGISPRYPAILQDTKPITYPVQQSYGAGNEENIVSGLDSSVSYQNRPLNPIETKAYRNPRLYPSPKVLLNISPLNVNNIPPILSTPLYSSTPFAYQALNYPIKPVELNKHLLNPVTIKNTVPNHVQKHLGLPLYKSPVVQSFYPKVPLPTPVFPYQVPTRPLIHLPPLRTMPQIIPSSYPKVQNFYKSPHMLIRAPTSGINHVPITTSQQYPINNEYLYHTASTPQSTHILGTGNKQNGSFFYPEKKYPGGHENRSQSYPGQKHLDFRTSSVHSHNGVPTSGIDENKVDAKLRDIDTYIFVSGTGNQDNNPDGKKQFFHAYYAPGDHEAPPGYVRMTIQEFNNLFKNAEIRYVDKEPTNASS